MHSVRHHRNPRGLGLLLLFFNLFVQQSMSTAWGTLWQISIGLIPPQTGDLGLSSL